MSQPVKSKFSMLWTLSICPVSPNSTSRPCERGEATAAISSIGKLRSARILSISRPTFPVAPTTTTR